MARGRRGRYKIRKQISEVLIDSSEPLTAEGINAKLKNQKNSLRRTYRNNGYSNNSVSQLLRGAHGIETSTQIADREQNYRKTKSFKVVDADRFTTWVESKRRPRNGQ